MELEEAVDKKLEIWPRLMAVYAQFEPPHDKTNKMTVHPAKTQISLGIAQSDQSLHCALNG